MTGPPFTVWLASYPKSGNTWARALLTALDDDDAGATAADVVSINALGHGPIASARGPLTRWLGIPSSDLTLEETAALRPLVDAELDRQLDELRFRKIHDGLFTGAGGAPIVPRAATRGAVYIVRDPRDVAVSFAHHLGKDVAKVVRWMGPEADETTWYAGIQQLPQHLGSWSAHVRGWLDQDRFPVLLVRYEDLHAHTARELARIAAFAALPAGDEQIRRAIERAAFARLQRAERDEPFRERPRHDAPFFRRGLAGGWVDELPAALARRIETDHDATMRRLGYAIPVAGG